MSARPQLAFRFRAPDMHTWYRSVTELWRSMSNRQVPCESIVKAVTDKISPKSRANIYWSPSTHTREMRNHVNLLNTFLDEIRCQAWEAPVDRSFPDFVRPHRELKISSCPV